MRQLSGWIVVIGMSLVLFPSFAVRAQAPIRERVFLNQVIGNGRAEIKYCELAEKNAGSLKVKAFAARLIVEHKRFGEKMEAAAEHLNINIDKELDRDQMGTLDGLSKRTGAEFDRNFLARIIKDYERGVSAFQTEVKRGNAEEVKKLCEDALPRLQRDLRRARQLAEEVRAK
jgi:putative membrane protein